VVVIYLLSGEEDGVHTIRLVAGEHLDGSRASCLRALLLSPPRARVRGLPSADPAARLTARRIQMLSVRECVLRVCAMSCAAAKRSMSRTVGCHVYSVQQVLPTSEQQLWHAEHDAQLAMAAGLRTGAAGGAADCLEDNRHGAIRTDGARRAIIARPQPTPAAPAAPTPAPKKPVAASSEAVSGFFAASGSKAAAKAADEPKKSAAEPPAKPAPKPSGVASMFAKQTAVAKQAAADAADVPPAPSASKAAVAAPKVPSAPSAETAAARKRSRIVCEDDDDDADGGAAVVAATAPSPAEPAAKPAAKPAETTAQPAAKLADKPPAKPPAHASPVRASPARVTRASPAKEPAAAPAAQNEASGSAAAAPPARKKRIERHKRTRTTVDAKGYMVTEEYYEEVEVDEPEPAARPTPAPKHVAAAEGESSKKVKASSPPKQGKSAHAPKAKVAAAGKLTSFFTKK
jgi:hypothetical protein